jgi:hypothetical protein
MLEWRRGARGDAGRSSSPATSRGREVQAWIPGSRSASLRLPWDDEGGGALRTTGAGRGAEFSEFPAMEEYEGLLEEYREWAG